MKYLSVVLLLISCIGNPNKTEPEIDIELVKFWSTNIQILDTPDTYPLVVNDMIIYSGGLDLNALDIETGENIWSYEVGEGRPLNGCYIGYDEENKHVYFSNDEDFRVLDVTDGKIVLNVRNLVHHCGKHIKTPDGYVVIGDTLDAYLLDNNGNILNEYNLSMGAAGANYLNNVIYLSQVETVHGLLTKGRISAIDIDTGDSLWAYNTDNGGFHWTPPIIEGEILYGGTTGNSPEEMFVALDLQTHQPKWEYKSVNPLEYTRAFTIGENFIYIKSSSYLFVLDKETGTKVWDFELLSSSTVNLLYLGGYLYLSNHYFISILDGETGELVHKEQLPENGGYFWGIAASDSVFFAQTSTQIIAYEPWHLRNK